MVLAASPFPGNSRGAAQVMGGSVGKVKQGLPLAEILGNWKKINGTSGLSEARGVLLCGDECPAGARQGTPCAGPWEPVRWERADLPASCVVRCRAELPHGRSLLNTPHHLVLRGARWKSFPGSVTPSPPPRGGGAAGSLARLVGGGRAAQWSRKEGSMGALRFLGAAMGADQGVLFFRKKAA